MGMSSCITFSMVCWVRVAISWAFASLLSMRSSSWTWRIRVASCGSLGVRFSMAFFIMSAAVPCRGALMAARSANCLRAGFLSLMLRR